MRPSARTLLLLTGVVVLTVILFARATTYGYVWDDVHEIQHAPAFDRPLWDGLQTTQTERTDEALTESSQIRLAYDSYRPVLFATYWVEIRIAGRSAGLMHVTNLVIHVLSILGVFLLGRRLLKCDPAALGVAAVFALHPVQIETVAYISARADLLMTFFSILCLLAALRRWAVLAGLAFALAMFTKETAIGLPVAIAAVLWSQDLLAKSRTTLGLFAGVVVIYFVVRHLVVVPTTGGALWPALVHMPGVWLEYLRIAALPFDLSTERMHSSTLVYAGWPVAVALAALLIRARNRPHVREIAGGLAWFAAMLAPAAVAVTSSGVAADRYIAAPLLGLLFAAVAAARILVGARASLRRPLLGVGALWGVLLLIVAWRQVPVWRTNETLYAHATVMTPGSSDAFYRLGYLAATRDDWDEAIPLLEHSVELDGRNVRALNNLAVGYLRTHREADAEQTLQRAVDVSPAAYRSWFNLGVARLALGKRDEGCAAVNRALEIQPAYEQARQVRAQSCRK